jgi:hypothetical protein
MAKIDNFLVGSDPEWFLVNIGAKKFVSSEGIIGGTKKNPLPVGGGFFVQEDNVAAEGNIPPAATKEELVRSIEILKKKIQSIAPEGVTLFDGCTANFTEKELETKQGAEFGCLPDNNDYLGEQNDPVEARPGECERHVGAHIWIGYNDSDSETNRELVKAADLFLGVPSVLLDKDCERRNMYGKAGSYREKDFGVEYRVLSNFWTRSKKMVEWAYEGVEKTVKFVNEGSNLNVAAQQAIVATINGYDRREAKKICSYYGIL